MRHDRKNYRLPKTDQNNLNLSIYGLKFNHPELRHSAINWGKYTPLVNPDGHVFALKARKESSNGYNYFILKGASSGYTEITDQTLITELNDSPATVESRLPPHIAISKSKQNNTECYTLTLPDGEPIKPNTNPVELGGHPVKVSTVNSKNVETIISMSPINSHEDQKVQLGLSLSQLIPHQNEDTKPILDYKRYNFCFMTKDSTPIQFKADGNKSNIEIFKEDIKNWLTTYNVESSEITKWHALFEKSGMQSQNFEVIDLTVVSNALNTMTQPIPIRKIYSFSDGKLIMPTHTLILNLGPTTQGAAIKFKYLKTLQDGSMEIIHLDPITQQAFERKVKEALQDPEILIELNKNPGETIKRIVNDLALEHNITNTGETLNIPYLGKIKLSIDSTGKTEVLESSFYSDVPNLFNQHKDIPIAFMDKADQATLKENNYTRKSSQDLNSVVEKALTMAFLTCLDATTHQATSPLSIEAIIDNAKKRTKSSTLKLELAKLTDKNLQRIIPVDATFMDQLPIIIVKLQQQLAIEPTKEKQKLSKIIQSVLDLTLPQPNTSDELIKNINIEYGGLPHNYMEPKLKELCHTLIPPQQLQQFIAHDTLYGFKERGNPNTQTIEVVLKMYDDQPLLDNILLSAHIIHGYTTSVDLKQVEKMHKILALNPSNLSSYNTKLINDNQSLLPQLNRLTGNNPTLNNLIVLQRKLATSRDPIKIQFAKLISRQLETHQPRLDITSIKQLQKKISPTPPSRSPHPRAPRRGSIRGSIRVLRRGLRRGQQVPVPILRIKRVPIPLKEDSKRRKTTADENLVRKTPSHKKTR